MPPVKCGSTKVHNFHSITHSVVKKCSGKLACGSQIHEPHSYTVTETKWCRGICGCNGKKDHGPGEHK